MLNVSMDMASFRRFERFLYYLAPPLYCDKPGLLWVSLSKKIGIFFFLLCTIGGSGGGGGGGGGCGCGCGCG